MNQRIRRILAILTLTTAAATGYALTDEPAAQPAGDSTWGAPDTSDIGDTVEDGSAGNGMDDATITPFDTTWG